MKNKIKILLLIMLTCNSLAGEITVKWNGKTNETYIVTHSTKNSQNVIIVTNKTSIIIKDVNLFDIHCFKVFQTNETFIKEYKWDFEKQYKLTYTPQRMYSEKGVDYNDY